MPDELTNELIALSDRLLATSVRTELPGRSLDRQIEKLAPHDYVRLVNEAALLAQSSDSKARTIAYEIVTHSLRLSKRENGTLARAVEFILARLGNFPGRDLLRSRYRVRLDGASSIPASLFCEALGHEHENTIETMGGETLKLTDFQHDLFEAMKQKLAVSVSAPTSAGKSFVLSLQILRKIQETEQAAIVYVVPTRALIREVVLRLRQALQRTNLTEVALRSIPQPIAPSDAPCGVIYVLTQERLLSLLHAAGEEFRLTLLIVDEAQGVRDGGRGVLLQSAIDLALRKCPKAEVIFASPLISNPQYLLNLFGKHDGVAPLELHSPVAQSIITVSCGEKDRRNAAFSLLRHGEKISLGERKLGFDFSSLRQIVRRARFAVSVSGEREACLVYANGASEAEETAEAIAELRPNRAIPQEVLDFVSYVQEYIHPEYALLRTLKCGVGFHHGEMPASVRAGVEDLFRERRIQFMCCTGTLLQGVNLPARHLVVERPRRGNGQPMNPADFLNLAGRAGRLRREFHGNVWCLRPEYWQSQPHDNAELPNVESAFEAVMRDGGKSIQRLLDGQTNADPDGAALASISRLLTEYIRPDRPPDFQFNPESADQLRGTFAALRALPLTLPSEIFDYNSGVLPTKIEELYLTLNSETNLEEWLPMPPFDAGFYGPLLRIFELLHRVLHGKTSLEYRFDAWLASRWIHQDTLQEIIDSRITWRRSKGLPTDVRDIIRKVIRKIERGLRYKWVRSLRVFHDVMGVILRSRGKIDEADSLRPLYLYLEYGAYDRPILSLISLGFSRTAALVLRRLIAFPSDSSPERCRAIILSRNLALLRVPAVIQKEAYALLGRP